MNKAPALNEARRLMPNWCENDVTVSGSKEAVEEFLKFAAGESPFDFIPTSNRFFLFRETTLGLPVG